MNKSCMLSVNRIIGGRYRIVETLGHGACGTVALANDIKLGRNWAIKVVSELADNEVAALRTLNHPAFPRIVDIISDEACTYIVMDFIEGIDLETWLTMHTPTNEQIATWALRIATAIEYLHMQSPPMLYMDCKPANIILGVDGNIYLVDMGSVYICDGENNCRVSGTIGYASPEQRTGKPVDARSDVYSYGMTMYRIVTGGKREYRDKHGRLDVAAHAPHVSRKLCSIISDCTWHAPAYRYQSMAQVVHALTLKYGMAAPHAHTADTLRYSRAHCINILLSIFMRLGQIGLTMLTVMSYYRYSVTTSLSYFVLADVMFLVLIIIGATGSPVSWECKEDVFRGVGRQILTGLLPLVCTLLLIPATHAYAEEHAYKDKVAAQPDDTAVILPNDAVTLYDEDGCKVLYKGQKVYSVDDKVYVSIPTKSIGSDELPIAVIRKR